MTHDGIGKYLSQVVEKAPGETDDVVAILEERNVDVVVNYLPVGSEEATKWYAEQILAAGCAMVNCMPVFIAREPYSQRRFEQAGVPIIGDDIKSQARAEHRRGGCARGPELIPDEGAAEADRGRRGVRAERGVHRAPAPQEGEVARDGVSVGVGSGGAPPDRSPMGKAEARAAAAHA